MMMVTLPEFEASVDYYVEQAHKGDLVVITREGKPIARLEPYRRTGPAPEEYAAMVEKGLIRPGQRNLGPEFWDLPRPSDPEGLVLKALLEEREEER